MSTVTLTLTKIQGELVEFNFHLIGKGGCDVCFEIICIGTVSNLFHSFLVTFNFCFLAPVSTGAFLFILLNEGGIACISSFVNIDFH